LRDGRGERPAAVYDGLLRAASVNESRRQPVRRPANGLSTFRGKLWRMRCESGKEVGKSGREGGQAAEPLSQPGPPSPRRASRRASLCPAARVIHGPRRADHGRWARTGQPARPADPGPAATAEDRRAGSTNRDGKRGKTNATALDMAHLEGAKVRNSTAFYLPASLNVGW